MSSRLHKRETKDLAKAARNITLDQLSKQVVVCRDFSEVDSQPHRRLLQRRQLRPGHRRAPTRAATRTTLVLVDALLAVRRLQRERESWWEHTAPRVPTILLGSLRPSLRTCSALGSQYRRLGSSTRRAHSLPFCYSKLAASSGPCLLSQTPMIKMSQ